MRRRELLERLREKQAALGRNGLWNILASNLRKWMIAQRKKREGGNEFSRRISMAVGALAGCTQRPTGAPTAHVHARRVPLQAQ